MSDTMPYGATPPEPVLEPDTEVTPEEIQEPAADEPNPEADYQKRYEELSKKFGEHSNVVGELRKQNQAMSQQMADIQQQAATREKEARNMEPPTDYEKMLTDIADKLDQGQISERDALVQSNKITREWTKAEGAQEREQLLNQARSEVQNILSQKDSDQVVSKFHEKNPDFQELQSQGAFDQLKAEDPLLDDLSAFWKYKATTAAQEKTAAFEAGKQDALRIKGGSDKAGKVLADPGTSMQTQQKSNRPASEAEIKASMLAKFQ